LEECSFEIKEGEEYEETIFTDFLVTGGIPVYQEIMDRQKLKNLINKKLFDYNSSNITMNIVMFKEAISYLLKIYRIIKMGKGHAMLIGEGGSGRHSLTQLAAYIARFETF